MTKNLGGAGGGGSPTVVKDNVRSQDSVEFLLGICEGPIAGLVDGPKSFYVGDTPLTSAAGDDNFEAFELHVYHGDDDATRIVPKMGGTATNVQVGVELAQYVPVVRTTPASLRGKIDRLEVRIGFQQMLRTNNDGDQLEATAQFILKYRRADQVNWRSFVGDRATSLDINIKRTATTTIGSGNPTVVVTNSTVPKSPFFGNLFQRVADVGVGAFTLANAVVDTKKIGSVTYTRKAVKTYGTLWFLPSTGQYYYEVNEAAVAGLSSLTDATETFGLTASSTSNGWSTGYYTRTVQYEISFAVTSRSLGIVSVKAKTGSLYIREYTRNIPEADRNYTGDWEISIERLTTQTDQNLFVKFSWESFQCVDTDANLKFNNLAVLRGLGAASNQFSSIPNFSGIFAGKLIRIPTNYDPITRVYNGVWNGTFKFGYTDNPAWCLYDMIFDQNYGFRKHYPELLVDKWSFYEAAQWCDVLVPRAGSTGFQPRYTYNDLIDQPRGGMEAAQYVASIFGGIITSDLNGTIRLRLDKPGTPVQIFGPENITVEGFQYQFADISTRANDFLVTFINPELDWAQDVRQVSSETYIEKNGRIPMDFVAVGCVDPFEAQRRAHLRMISANTEITTVTFTTTRPGILLEPYDIIGIVDPHMNWGLSGRIKSVAGGVITLRDELFLAAGATYNMTVQTKTGPQELVVQNTGGAVSKELTRVSGFLLQNLPENAQFALTSASIGLVKPFRVLSIQEVDNTPDLYSISAIEINQNKQTDADNMTVSPSVRYAFEKSAIPATPQNVEIFSGTEELYVTADGTVRSRIRVTWDQDPLSFVEEYRVFYRRIDRDAYSKVVTSSTDAYIDNVKDGMTYQIYVVAVNSLGRPSAPTAVFSHTAVGKNEAPTTPTNLVVSQMGVDVRLDWDDIPDLDLDFYEIRIGGTTWETATRLGTSKVSAFTHANANTGTTTYRIKSVDTSGNRSVTSLNLTYVIPLPGQPSMTVAFSGPNYVVNMNSPSGQAVPLKEYVLHLDGTEIFRGAANTFSGRVNWVGTKQFSLTAINTGNQQSTPFTANLAVAAPSQLTVLSSVSEGNYVFSWNIPGATLPIERYVIRNKTQSIILDDDLKATTFILPINWLGVREFEFWAVDSAGNAGAVATVSATVVAPQVQNLQTKLFRSNLELSWSGVPGTLPIKNYQVRLGETFISSTYFALGIPGEDQTNSIVATLNALNWSTPVDWNGTRSYIVVAEDIMGNLSEPAQVFETVDPPEAPSVSVSIVDKSLRLQWPEPSSELRIREYEVYRDGALVQKVSATTALVPINFSGTKTYRVRAIDEAGNIGPFGDVVSVINAPSAFSFTAVIVGEEVRLSWNTPTGSLPIAEYEIVYGASNTLLTRVAANSYSFKANWVGTETFKITAIDVAGNTSPQQTAAVQILAASAPVVRPEVLDNNVLLRWTPGSGTLPVVSTEIRRGATFATATVLQSVDATFATFFEFQSGVYTYWLVNIDSAGNYGTPVAATVNVAQPPDFTLQTDFDSVFGGTKTLAVLNAGTLYMGVDPAQTYEQHFTSDGFASPQAQISAGYPFYLQPNNTGSSSYQEIYDYGTPLSSTTITVTPTVSVIAGNPSVVVDIDVRLTTGDAWTNIATASTQGYATSFRYVRFTVRLLKDSRDDILALTRLNVRLSSKIRNDAGTGTANSADSGGTQVNFNVAFVDVQSISVTPLSTSARFAVYDFVDTANPTGFKVLMYDANGTRVSGNFSWQARGY